VHPLSGLGRATARIGNKVVCPYVCTDTESALKIELRVSNDNLLFTSLADDDVPFFLQQMEYT
jgi:hypothetical protein